MTVLDTTDWSAVAALAGLGGVALGFGASVGRVVRNVVRERAHRQAELRAIHDAMVGTPSTQFGPGTMGLVQITGQLEAGLRDVSDAQTRTAEAVKRLADDFHDHEQQVGHAPVRGAHVPRRRTASHDQDEA